MYRSRVLTIVLVLMVFLASCTPAKTNTPKVLLILQEYSESMDIVLKNEVGVMAKMIEDAGYKVVYSSKSGKTIGSGDSAITPDLKLSDVNIDDYVGLILPCMANSSISFDLEMTELVSAAAAAGMPIAAQRAAVKYLNAAQVSAVSYSDPKVVQEGKIITSGICPYAALKGLGKDETQELTQNFFEVLKSSS